MRSIEAYMEKSYELSSLPSYNQHMNMKMNSPQRTLGRDNNGRRELTLARMSTNNLAAPGGPGMADPPHHGQPTSTFGGHGHPHLRTRLGNSRHNMSTLQMHKNGQSNSTLEQLSPVYFSSNDRIV
ncbi:hypothetical protein HDE_00017 [Halotydeus destructor]|nr:hypothetical protein HDE_00017 [Halotydeus destructor]